MTHESQTNEMERALRQAFSARVDRLPGSASARVRAGDYRPAERRLRRSAVLGGGALAGAAATGAVLSIVLGSAAPAYAGWSAVPTSSAPASLSAVAQCLNQLNAPPGGAAASGTWSPVLTDVRGPFTTILFENGSAGASCFTSSSFTTVNQVSTTGTSGDGVMRSGVSVHGASSGSGAAPATGSVTSGSSVDHTASGDLTQVVQDHLSTSADGAYTFVDGRTASGVSAVTLLAADGQAVVATVSNGWFVAWWPGSASATSAQVTTPSGTTSEPLVGVTLPSPPPVPTPGSCPTSTQSGGEGGPSVSCAGSGSAGNSGNSGPSAASGTSGG
jgi:hypothetical protein